MNSKSVKEKLHSYIESGDEALINMLFEVATSYNSSIATSLDAYNKDIEESLEQFKKGEFITQKELEEQSTKW